jgi:hypothetical protein
MAMTMADTRRHPPLPGVVVPVAERLRTLEGDRRRHVRRPPAALSVLAASPARGRQWAV